VRWLIIPTRLPSCASRGNGLYKPDADCGGVRPIDAKAIAPRIEAFEAYLDSPLTTTAAAHAMTDLELT